MAAYGLYTHIQANKRRSAALMVGLFFLVYVLTFAGALFAEAASTNAPLDRIVSAAMTDLVKALPFVTVGTLLWIWIAYKFHQRMIDAITGGEEVTRAEQPRLYNLLENLCISRGIPTPKLKVMESGALNAFATGMNEKQYSITVTSALLNRLDDQEIEAVLGHELTHIRNGDVRLLVVAVIIAGVISFFAELVFRLMFQGGLSFRGSRSSSSSDRKGGGGAAILIAVALLAVAWILSVVIRLALSRQREFLADAGSVELTKNPDAMITALRKIEGRGELQGATSAVMEMCIDNPREGFADLFSTHPAIDKRIDAIVKFAGGHDPGPIALPDDTVPQEGRPEQSDQPEQGNQPQPGEPPLASAGIPVPAPGGAFLPPQPPIQIRGAASPLPSAGEQPGPWGPHRGGGGER